MNRKKYIILVTIFVITGVALLFSVVNAGAKVSAAQNEKCGYDGAGSGLLKLEDVLERDTSGYAGIDRGDNITWAYNAATKTLTFSGSGKIMSNDAAYDFVNGGVYSYQEDILGTWYIWREETEHIVIGEGITGIGYSDFMHFSYLTDVSLPNSLRYISDMAFAFGGLKSITIPKGVKDIGQYAFCGTKLSKVTIKNGVKRIWRGAFSDTLLKEIKFPQSVNYLGEEMLRGCEKLKKVTLPVNIEEIPDNFFCGCSRLQQIHIPQSVIGIGKYAFADTQIKDITLPQSVNYLNERVFSGNNKLRTVKIKSRKLKEVIGTFEDFSSKAVIIVSKGKKESYSKMFYKAGLSKKVKIKESKTW